MSIVKIPSAAIGINRDAMPEELPLGQWSNGQNVRFRAGFLERIGGLKQVYTAPSVTPYFVAPYITSSDRYIVHAGTARVYVDGSAGRTDITPASTYTGQFTDRWSGGVLSGVLVLNNGVQVPQYWMGNIATPLADLPNWNAAHKCACLRPWKNYLFALDITKSGTRYPYMVKWSSAADPGTYPASWNEADPSNDAGELDLAETPDTLVDAVPLGQSLVIYKQRSMYAASYIGGQYIFQFSRLPGEAGLLAKGCAVQTPVGHVVLTHGDVILHSGAGPKSIADGIVRRAIFDAIDTTLPTLAFLALHIAKSEVWVCYPLTGQTACTMAAIWNWEDGTWTFRSLPNATYGTTSQVVDSVASSDTWAGAVGDWSTDVDAWGYSTGLALAQAQLVLSHSTPALSTADNAQQDLGAPVSAYVERTGIHLDAPTRNKIIRRLWPKFDAAAGTQLSIQVGGSMTPDVAPTYGSASTFTVGTDSKLDVFANGRYLALKISSSADNAWRMKGIDLDVSMGGWF